MNNVVKHFITKMTEYPEYVDCEALLGFFVEYLGNPIFTTKKVNNALRRELEAFEWECKIPKENISTKTTPIEVIAVIEGVYKEKVKELKEAYASFVPSPTNEDTLMILKATALADAPELWKEVSEFITERIEYLCDEIKRYDPYEEDVRYEECRDILTSVSSVLRQYLMRKE